MSTCAPAPPRTTERTSAGARRAAWFVAALAWSVLGVMAGVQHGRLAGLAAAVFFVAADLTFLAGLRDAPRMARGQLPPRAVPLHNAAHRALVPLTLLGLCAALPGKWAPALAALCGWLAHISYDRAFGYGPRTKEGFQRG